MFRSFCLLLITGFFPVFVFAGYAQLVPPPAFQSVGGVSTMNVGAAANGARYAGGHVIANASLNLGARTVTVPVAMRVAANAATFAVTKLNPWIAGLQLASLAIPFIVDWFKGSPLEVTPDGLIQVRGSPGSNLDINQTRIADGRTVAQAVAGLTYGADIVDYLVSERKIYCGSGSYAIRIMGVNYLRNVVGSWCMSPDGLPVYSDASPSRPATQDDLSILTQLPINPQALVELGLPLPVDPIPIVNPSAEPVGDIKIGPDGNPAPELKPYPEPLRYPNGNPVPIPNTNPQTYSQPFFVVTPAPTLREPWRVNIAPIVIEVPSPAPHPDPDGTIVEQPDPDPPFDFYTDCDKFPNSLGCSSVRDIPPFELIPSEDRVFSLQSGPSFSGSSCPSDVSFVIAGKTIDMVDMSVPCGWITGMVKPVFILLAFITAFFIIRKAI